MWHAVYVGGDIRLTEEKVSLKEIRNQLGEGWGTLLLAIRCIKKIKRRIGLEI